MTQQYLRQFSLVVADPNGAGLEFGTLRCVFEVRRGDTQSPNTCDVRIYNVAPNTVNRLRTPEFTQLALSVGYGTDPTQLQQIFRGSIRQVRSGREDQLNSYVAITGADADEAYNFAAFAKTLAAGYVPTQGIQLLIAQMATAAKGTPTGGSGGQVVSQGYMPNLTTSGSVRGRTFFGMCVDELRDLAKTNDCTYSIQDGQLHFIPLAGYIPGEAVLITPYTGLINVPEQTQNGLEMTVLMNPSIKIGQLVKLDSSDVNQFRYGTDTNSARLNTLLALSTTKLNADGLYYVMRTEHFGDTRGNAWYSRLTCLAIDATQNQNTITSAAIHPVNPTGIGAGGNVVPRY